MTIGGVLLAAGRGTRFGGAKLLQPLADGTPIAVAAARSLCNAVDSAVAVVRAGDEDLAGLLAAEGLDPVVFADADEGMGASLAFGVDALHDAEGWVIALADMPFVLESTVRAVAAALARGASLAAPSYRGRRGHPVGFAHAWRAELTALRGDQGARGMLERHPDMLLLCPTADPGILQDVDTRQDLLEHIV